jgi:hypothetical protein
VINEGSDKVRIPFFNELFVISRHESFEGMADENKFVQRVEKFRVLGAYSQYFIFFVTEELAQ